MEFIRKEKVGTGKTVFEFYGRLDPVALSEVYFVFERIGGKFIGFETDIWEFPNSVTTALVATIFENTCFKCGGLMTDGQAIQNSLVSSEDFGGDAGENGTTQTRTGPPKIIAVRKCSKCGHSHT
mgnify:CR=1 FL=1